MSTVTFSVKPHLAAYMYVRHEKELEKEANIVLLPSIHLNKVQPIYHILYQRTVPHPRNAALRRKGNITFTLPHPRFGKNPVVYNYIGTESAECVEKEIEVEMKAELYPYMLRRKFNDGISYTLSLRAFMMYYQLDELLEERSVMRGFQRWRKMTNGNRGLEEAPY